MPLLQVLTLPTNASRTWTITSFRPTATVNFRVGSAVLSPEAKASLDQVAATATTLKGYMIEVTGFASAEGGTKIEQVA